MLKLFLSPHNDDESLFGAYTLMREKPLVVVVYDSYVQDWVTTEERREETAKAMAVISRPYSFIGLNDKTATRDDTYGALSEFTPDVVYAPTGSHKHHTWLGEIARELWGDKVILYTTYETSPDLVIGSVEIKPTDDEIATKNAMLDCYVSQLEKNKPHFDAVRNRSEYYA